MAHGISNTRIYRIENEFYCYTVDREGIKPYGTTILKEIAEHLDEVINRDWGIVNLHFCYMRGSLSKNKRKKMNTLLDQQGIVDTPTLTKWITLLL